MISLLIINRREEERVQSVCSLLCYFETVVRPNLTLLGNIIMLDINLVSVLVNILNNTYFRGNNSAESCTVVRYIPNLFGSDPSLGNHRQ